MRNEDDAIASSLGEVPLDTTILAFVPILTHLIDTSC